MKNRFRTCSIAALALALTIAPAASHTTGADTLRLRLKVGESLRYKSVTTTATDMMGLSTGTVVTTVQVIQVLEQSGGWTRVRVTTEELEMGGDEVPGIGEMMAAMKDVSYTFDVAETGLTRRLELENTDALDPMVLQTVSGGMRAQQVVGFLGVHFPIAPITRRSRQATEFMGLHLRAKPLRIGTRWEAAIDASKMIGANELISSVDGEIVYQFEVIGYSNLGRKRHIMIRSASVGIITMVLGTPAVELESVLNMESVSTYWIDLANGTVTKMVGKGTIESNFGIASVIHETSTTVTRVK